MRKKLSCLLLSGALALSLAACAPAEEEPSPSPLPSAPPPESSVQVLATPTPESTVPPEAAADFDLPDRDYQPWQVGYMKFLTALLQAEQDVRGGEGAFGGLAVDGGGVKLLPNEWPNVWNAMEMGSESYSLYDVDRDGVPELFVKYGNCEAAFTYQCYTWRDGRVVCIGEFAGGHSSLYAHPDKSAVLRNYGQMGCAVMYEYPMEGGVLTEEREIFSEEDVREYTPMEEIVPGARYMEYYYTPGGSRDNSFFTGRTPYALGSALVLPICDYYDGPAATGHSTETARRTILAALNGETELYGASGDHFNGDVGPGTWEEYIQMAEGRPNTQVTARVAAYTWVDMNGDSQEECLLQMETEGVRNGETVWTGEAVLMLSEQGGTVYAYYFGVYYHSTFCEDGTILDNYGKTCRLSFWKGQCYEYAAPDTSAPAVKWADGSPAG